MTTYNVGTCVMLIIFVLFLCDVVTAIGREGRRNISREDYWTAKRKLQSLNRPSVKSIQTQNGDIFDCVDINKQPAFDHPLLKDHTIQLRPSFVLNHMKENSSYATLDDIGLENGGCPDGTVPILRTQAADLLRANSISDFGRKLYGEAHRYAIKQGSGKFYGVTGNLNLWKPNLVSDQQFSLSQMWIVNTTGVLNTIEAGWHVMPTIYRLDHTPRLFVYWTADNYKTTGCYNLLCPGFVQVNKFIPVGLPLDKVSQSMKVQREIQLIILRDPASGNWWLSYGPIDMIGYWPNALFTNLKEGGNQVSWGGEVCITAYDTPRTYPQMGSGAYSSRGYRKASYMSKLQVAEDQHQISFVEFNDSKPLVTIPHCYSVTDAHEPNLAPGFFFGGPGHCP